jgi:hypothetical protein
LRENISGKIQNRHKETFLIYSPFKPFRQKTRPYIRILFLDTLAPVYKPISFDFTDSRQPSAISYQPFTKNHTVPSTR